MAVQAVILAAGMGTRLARPHPKALTQLDDGRTFMSQQVENLRVAFGDELTALTIVVGYKLEQIMEHVPDASFIYNEAFDQTNTSKSSLKELRNSADGGVLWMNGDVDFDPDLLIHIASRVHDDRSFVAVDTSVVSDVEVKYTVVEDGDIRELSKTVVNALGEAVGINHVSSSSDKKHLIRRLDEVEDQEYFEGGIVKTIQQDNVSYLPVAIGRYYAVEVNFAEDLVRANDCLVPDSRSKQTAEV